MTPALVLAATLALLIVVGWWGAGEILVPYNRLDLTVFPELHGLRYEKVSFQTRDGLTLRGWFIPSTNGDPRTLLMCHGWGDNKGYLLERTAFLNKSAGFNLFYFDHRSHGDSDGTITTIGHLETIDFDAALEHLRRTRPAGLRLGVFGMSMGAAVTIMAMSKHPEVRGAVLESPFPDFPQVIRRWAWSHMRLPYFPVVMMTLAMLRLRVSAEVVRASPIRSIEEAPPRPLLFISGSDDTLMPVEDVRAVYERASPPKDLWIVPGAKHGTCHAVAGLEYETRVIEFFRKAI